MTKGQLGMEATRHKTLSAYGAAFPKIPLEIAPKEDSENPFRGDNLCGYITHFDKKNFTLTDESKFFPHGMHIVPREHGQF